MLSRYMRLTRGGVKLDYLANFTAFRGPAQSLVQLQHVWQGTPQRRRRHFENPEADRIGFRVPQFPQSMVGLSGRIRTTGGIESTDEISLPNS